MIKRTIDFGKSMKGVEIWDSWCISMSESLDKCLPQSAAAMMNPQTFREPEVS